MMRRRTFLAGSVGLLAAPLAADAQAQPEKVWRIGVLTALYPLDSAPSQAFRHSLRTLGYAEGQNLVIEWRYTEGRDDRLASLAAELVRLKVDLIVADVTLAIRAAKQVTSTTPIVMTNSADPVGDGLVSTLARPGGNVTGLSIMLVETSRKRLQLLKEAVPRVSRPAVLWNPATPMHRAVVKEITAAAPGLRLQPLAVAVRARDDFGDAFSEIRKGRADALVVSYTMSSIARRQLLDFAASQGARPDHPAVGFGARRRTD